MVLIAIGVFGWTGLMIVEHSDAWYTDVFSGLMGIYIAVGCLSFWRAQVGYKDGWIEGRQALLRSARESNQRGMTAEQWADAEWERDMAVLGYTISRTTEERAEDQ